MAKAADETQSGLVQMADKLKTLAEVVEDTAGRQETMDEILELFQTLKKTEKSALMREPAFREFLSTAAEEPVAIPNDARPGTVINAGKINAQKVPWDWHHLKDNPHVTFIPVDTRIVGWNGLQIQVRARKPITVPDVHFGVYMDALHQQDLAEQHVAWMFAKSRDARPPLEDRSILSPGSHRVRALADEGTYFAGAGNLPDAPEMGREEATSEAAS